MPVVSTKTKSLDLTEFAMATKNSCAKLILAVVAVVSVSTAASAKVIGSPRKSPKITVRRDGASSRTTIHDHRTKTPSRTNIHDHRTRTPSRTNIHDHRTKTPSRSRAKAPNGKFFPVHWGAPPRRQTRDLRPLPGGYGRGSGTLARWIQMNLDRDAERKKTDE